MKRNKLGQFTSKGLKDNAFAKNNKSNKTSFKPSHIPHNFKGTYTPRIIRNNRDGKHVVVTVDETKSAISRNRSYVTKKRLSYAQHLMNTPKGMVTYHIDGNALNNDISNLEIITRKELLKRNLS